METNFNFKSQPCTSKEQSERLLALGLKKETADMGLVPIMFYDDASGKEYFTGEYSIRTKRDIERHANTNHFPAWSLDRLKELYKCVGDTSLWNLDDVNYDRLIQCICLAIKHNDFNKEYLV